MPDEQKTKRQLLSELNALRKSYQALEAKTARYKKMHSVLKENKQKVPGDRRAGKSVRGKLKIQQDLETIFNSLTDFLFMLDEKGRILYCSSSVKKRLGYSDKDLRGKMILAVHPPAVHAEAASILSQVLEGKKDICPFPLLAKDGSLIHVETKITRARWETRDILFCVSRDITNQKRAEKQLKDSEERYSIMVNSSPNIVFVHRDGVILFVNDAASRVLGYSREELVGKTIFEFLAGDSKKLALRNMQRRLDGENVEMYEVKVFTKTKGEKDFFVSAAVIPYEKGRAFLVILSDITDYKKYASDLQESEERYRLLMQNANDAIYDHEVSPSGPGRILNVNEKACKMLGYTREELLKMRISDLDVPEQAEKVPGIIRSLYETGGAIFETEHLTKDGRRVPVEVSTRIFELRGKPAILSVVRDISERKRMEQIFHALIARQEAFLAAIPDIIMEVNNDKVYTWANQAGIEFFGDDVVGREASFYFEGPQKTYEFVQPLFNGKEEPIYVESWQRRRDGEKRLLAWWCKVIKDKSGNITGALSSARDVTDIKRVENELRVSEEKYRLAMDATMDGLWDWDILHGTVYYSPSWSKILGIRSINPVSEEWETRIHPDDKTECLASLSRHIDGQIKFWRQEHRLKADTGEWVWVVGRGRVVARDGEGKALRMVGTMTDISKRKQVEEEKEAISIISHLFLTHTSLEEVYSKLPLILSERFMFPVATVELYDPVKDTMILAGAVGGAYSSAHERFSFPMDQSISGKVAMTGKPVYNLNADCLTEEQLGIFRNMHIKTIISVPIKSKKTVLGTLSLADTHRRSGMGAFIKTLQVIANHLAQELERLKAWNALSKAKDEWEHTFDTVPDLICVLDKDFRIVRINLPMATRLGMDPKDCIGKKCYELVHKTLIPPSLCPHKELLKDGDEHIVELYEKTLEGYFLITTSPIYNEKGELSGSVHMAREITKQKQAEEEIRSSLREKELLLREIYHRVKNNMQIVSSLLKLSTEYIHDESVLNILNESQDRIKSMALVHEKLYHSTDLTRIDFSEYVESLTNELYRAHGVNRSRIALTLSMEPVFLSIDSAIPCGLIVNELIMNALKHAFPGDAQGEIILSLSEKDDGAVQLIISDNGVGIPPPIDLSKVKTLGLYIVNILAEDQLGGSIALDRRKGTTFRITFSKKDKKTTRVD